MSSDKKVGSTKGGREKELQAESDPLYHSHKGAYNCSTESVNSDTETDEEILDAFVPTAAVKAEPGTCAKRKQAKHSVHNPLKQYLASGDDVISSSTSQMITPNRSTSSSILPGNLVIKVLGDSLAEDASNSEVVNQLSKKLGVKVVLQMENSDGEVIFEDVVSSGQQLKSGELCDDSDVLDSKLFSPNQNVPEKPNGIVSTVLSTIRELSNRLGRMEELKDCPICGDAVTGFHYGVQTCESCKGFFKRTVQNKKEFKCSQNGSCQVSLSNRKKCPACRFQKCCDVGMRVEGIREDRSRGGRSTYEGSSNFLHRRFKRHSDTFDKYESNSKKIKTSEPPSPEPAPPKKIVPELLSKLVSLESLYEEISSEPMPCCVERMTNGDKNKFSSMLHITEHRLYQIVRWARHLPNFLNIPTQDQILLLQNCWAELTSLGAIWRSRFTPGVIHLSYGKTIDMVKAREMDHSEVISRMLYVCDNFRRLEVDEFEYVALKVLALMLPDISGLESPSMVQDYQNTLLAALMQYTSSHYPQYPTKFGELLIRLSEVQRLTAISRQQIRHLQAIGEVPQYSLLMELLKHQSYSKSGILSDERALSVIQSNYKNEDIHSLPLSKQIPPTNCPMSLSPIHEQFSFQSPMPSGEVVGNTTYMNQGFSGRRSPSAYSPETYQNQPQTRNSDEQVHDFPRKRVLSHGNLTALSPHQRNSTDNRQRFPEHENSGSPYHFLQNGSSHTTHSLLPGNQDSVISPLHILPPASYQKSISTISPLRKDISSIKHMPESSSNCNYTKRHESSSSSAGEDLVTLTNVTKRTSMDRPEEPVEMCSPLKGFTHGINLLLNSNTDEAIKHMSQQSGSRQAKRENKTQRSNSQDRVRQKEKKEKKEANGKYNHTDLNVDHHSLDLPASHSVQAPGFMGVVGFAGMPMAFGALPFGHSDQDSIAKRYNEQLLASTLAGHQAITQGYPAVSKFREQSSNGHVRNMPIDLSMYSSDQRYDSDGS